MKSTQRLKLWYASALFFFVVTLNAQMVTVTPNEYLQGMNNPFMGFRSGFSGPTNEQNWKAVEYNSIWRHYIKWSEIENDATDGVQKIIDFCNQAWQGCEAANVRIIPRVYVDWNSTSGNEYWPDDILSLTGLKADDPALWAHPVVKDRVEKLVAKLGQAWDNDSRVAWVQTGIVGYWGEQENPVGVDEEGWVERLGDAFEKAFRSKKLVVRNQLDWDASGYEWGVYWDSYGHYGQKNGAWQQIQTTNAEDRWLHQVVEGEVAYNWGLDKFVPYYGASPAQTLNNDTFTNNMLDVIKELHCTGLGWISDYQNSKYVNVDSVNANASRMQNEFGYRFVISDFTCPTRVAPGNTFNFSFNVTNTASAPFYYQWPLALVLVDEKTRLIKEKISIKNIDITKWLPGDTYNYSTRTYDVASVKNKVNASVQIPSNLLKANYLVGVSILEPSTMTPGIFFAMENFFKESQTQPMVRIGVGRDAESHTLSKVKFDDPKHDDVRYYSK